MRFAAKSCRCFLHRVVGPSSSHQASVYVQHMTRMKIQKERYLLCQTLLDEVLVFPVPHLLEEVGHVDLLRLHLHHPWMLEHTPRCSSPWAFLLKTISSQQSGHVQ